MFPIWYAVNVFVFATIISFLEIQIEGKNGWAKNLPCWRANKERLATKIYSWFQGGKEVTGYHLALNTLEFAIFHFPFFAGVSWNIVRELQIFSCLPLFWTFQDFTWFIWNPFYGLKKFNSQSIQWHKKWTGPVPTDYLLGIVFSGIFILVAMIFTGSTILLWWVTSLGILGGLTFISCIIQLIKGRV